MSRIESGKISLGNSYVLNADGQAKANKEISDAKILADSIIAEAQKKAQATLTQAQQQAASLVEQAKDQTQAEKGHHRFRALGRKNAQAHRQRTGRFAV